MKSKKPLLEIADVNTCMVFHQNINDEIILESLRKHMIIICNELSKFPIKPRRFLFDASRVCQLENSMISVPLHIELEVEVIEPTEEHNSFKEYIIKKSSYSQNQMRKYFRLIGTPNYHEEYKQDIKSSTGIDLWEKIKSVINEINTPKLEFSWNQDLHFFDITTHYRERGLEGH